MRKAESTLTLSVMDEPSHPKLHTHPRDAVCHADELYLIGTYVIAIANKSVGLLIAMHSLTLNVQMESHALLGKLRALLERRPI